MFSKTPFTLRIRVTRDENLVPQWEVSTSPRIEHIEKAVEKLKPTITLSGEGEIGECTLIVNHRGETTTTCLEQKGLKNLSLQTLFDLSQQGYLLLGEADYLVERTIQKASTDIQLHRLKKLALKQPGLLKKGIEIKVGEFLEFAKSSEVALEFFLDPPLEETTPRSYIEENLIHALNEKLNDRVKIAFVSDLKTAVELVNILSSEFDSVVEVLANKYEAEAEELRKSGVEI